jgi:hypothetical protein
MAIYIIQAPYGAVHTFPSCASLFQKRIAEQTGIPTHLQEIRPSFVSEKLKICNLPVHHYILFSRDSGRTFKIKIGTCRAEFFVKAHATTPVMELIHQLQQQVMMDLSKFALYDKQKQLSSEQVADEIENTELTLLPPPRDGEVLLFIKTMTGAEYPLNVPSHFTCDKLKGMIWERDGLPEDQQRLIAFPQRIGKQLEDAKTISEYQFVKGTVVHLMLRLRGGMFHKTSTGVLTDGCKVPHPEIVNHDTITIINDGKEIVVSIEPFYSVKAVKLLLDELAPIGTLTLYKGDLILEDNRTLLYYGIEYGDSLNLTITVEE